LFLDRGESLGEGYAGLQLGGSLAERLCGGLTRELEMPPNNTEMGDT
jgi:hypothetical protein